MHRDNTQLRFQSALMWGAESAGTALRVSSQASAAAAAR